MACRGMISTNDKLLIFNADKQTEQLYDVQLELTLLTAKKAVRLPFLIQSPNIIPSARSPITSDRICILGSVKKGIKILVGHLRPVAVPPGFLMVELQEEVGIEVVVDNRGCRVTGGVWVEVGERCSLLGKGCSLSLRPSLVDRGLAAGASHEV